MEIFYTYLIIGFILVALEIATTTLYLLVIGISFVLASLAALMLNNWVLVTLVAGILSIIGCFLAYKYKKRFTSRGNMPSSHIGQYVKVIEIDGDNFRVAYSGSYWDAYLVNKSIAVKIDDQLVINAVHGNVLELTTDKI
jgi:membrane protein implicated in regulation of membrane protease activity